jgi:thiol-disulfide isomerase/thioredoxin
MKCLFALLVITSCYSYAQTAYKTNETVPDLFAKKIINYTNTSASLNRLKGKITIIDFFGTWCKPCVKALPELKAFKNKFSKDLNIILISAESEAQLLKFIDARKPFDFPVIVDEENLFTNAFMPPAYPYTIVLDEDLKILSLTNMTDLTEEILTGFMKIEKEIADKTTTLIKPYTVKKVISTMQNSAFPENSSLQLSQQFVYAAKTNENTDAYILKLQQLNFDALLSDLKNDNERKAFWINLYNAYTNTALHKNPDQYRSRNTFFKTKNINVAGKMFSLDKIEHDILRRGKIKWSLGYLSKFFPSETVRQLRVDTLDYRIHFTLNCGAKSCPPIAFYKAATIDDQLNDATTAYLTSEVKYESEKNSVQVPILLSWFRRDFGGKEKIISLLKQKKLIPEHVHPKITFKKYDWALYLNNFNDGQ